MAENENVKVEENQVEETTEKKVEQITDNTLVVPATTEEKKPSKAGKILKIAGAVASSIVALAGMFLLGKKFGNKG